MKYYKDSENNLFAFESDGPQDSYIKDGMILITEEELDLIIAEKNKPTKEQIISRNESKVKLLIDEATLRIDLLQDAIDLEMYLDGDEDKLKSWRKYRVLLSRVDTNVEEIELPEKPE